MIFVDARNLAIGAGGTRRPNFDDKMFDKSKWRAYFQNLLSHIWNEVEKMHFFETCYNVDNVTIRAFKKKVDLTAFGSKPFKWYTLLTVNTILPPFILETEHSW